MQRTIDHLAETIINAKRRGKTCSVLIGAGCSVTAQIPTAKGFVEVIEKEYPYKYSRAKEKTYPKCMAELSKGERHDLIAKYVDNAKINWAHIALAQLMRSNFVDRVLTTNFDLLVMRACALLGIFPATYDFAASQLFNPADIPDQAVFYLHGQRTGFVLMNTENDLKEHSNRLAPIFEDAGRGRVWLVVGYSGESDPVFDHLAKVPCFDNCLYWVLHQNEEPSQHLKERLLLEGKDAFFVNGFDADSFFVTLAKMLGCFPPDLVAKPFTHLNNLLKTVTPYTFPKESAPVDVLKHARRIVESTIREVEKIHSEQLAAQANLLGGKYDEVIALVSKYSKGLPKDLADPVARALTMKGNAIADQARTKTGEEADQLFTLATNKYEEAVKIRPDFYGGWNNWGLALTYQARTKTEEEADRLYALAGEKYQRAIRVGPLTLEPWNNWGMALVDQGRTKTGKEADRLLNLAAEKLQRAVKIKPDDFLAWNNWGLALVYLARTRTGKEANQLLALARKKYIQAEVGMSGRSSYNLACVAAIRGKEKECLAWLQKSRESGYLPSLEHIAHDSDLDNVRNTDWFNEFLASLSM